MCSENRKNTHGGVLLFANVFMMWDFCWQIEKVFKFLVETPPISYNLLSVCSLVLGWVSRRQFQTPTYKLRTLAPYLISDSFILVSRSWQKHAHSAAPPPNKHMSRIVTNPMRHTQKLARAAGFSSISAIRCSRFNVRLLTSDVRLLRPEVPK